jgi:uncharacterized protein involved in exopolysaccharide biosynthesis
MTPEYTRRGLLTVLFRQKWKFLIVFGAVIAAFGTYLSLTKLTYSATGTMLIRFGQDADPNVKPGNPPAFDTGSQDHREIIQSDVDIIASRDMLRALVGAFGPARLYPPSSDETENAPVESAITRLQTQDLIVRPSAESDLISVTLFNRDPALAAEMTRRLMDMFIERQSQIYNKPQTGFLADEVTDAAAKLAKAQEALRTFKTRNGMSSLDDELQQLMKERADARTLAQQSVAAAETKLADLQSRRRELLNTYRADSTAVRNIDTAIALAQDQLQARESDLKASGDLVTPHIAELNRRIGELESERTAYNDLSREVDIDEAAYKAFVTRSEDARIDQALAEQRITRVTIIDRPVTPIRPSRPRRKLIAALGLLAATLAGLGTAFAFELLDDRFSDARGVRSTLGVPVFATFGNRKTSQSA